MNDRSYAGQVSPSGVTRRVNAGGNMVAIEEFRGHFVWADYAAPWCQPCIPQAQAIKQVETSLGERVVFLTVMTSASEEYASIPDRQTAKAWANRFGLNPERVVAATNLWAWTIPTHILFSPEGQPSIVPRVIFPQVKSTTSFRITSRIGRNGREADTRRNG